ncbi:Folic acid synthesis protein FOL1 [Nakaseomyces bracarensis]|uniref:Folic acid synthesis protein fol1 n=1 Tax=Nakaseomyces bracarensis TaxID=273131 RepID=A0ABR4NYD1_9SACH
MHLKTNRDHVHVVKLEALAKIGPDRWGQPIAQRCSVSLDMGTDFSKSSETDDLQYSLNYAVISRDITKYMSKVTQRWNSVGMMTRSVAQFAMDSWIGIESLRLDVTVPTAHIRTENVSCVVHRSRTATPVEPYDYIRIRDLKMLTIIGVFTFERLQRQFVTLDIDIPWPRETDTHIQVNRVIDNVVHYVEHSNFKTVEALVEGCCSVIAHDSYFGHEYKDLPIKVKVIKLNAITDTEGVGVSCIRTPRELLLSKSSVGSESQKIPNNSEADVFNLPISNDAQISKGSWNTAYLAFGSNIEPRVQNVELALDLLKNTPGVELQTVSSYFESEPMYFKDQSPFLNGCVQIKTQLAPHELLDLCKEIEYKKLHRVKHFDNGPRTIDLDIIFYLNSDDEHVLVNDASLIVPHAKMLERTFVLEPICELVSPEFIHPISTEPVFNHLENLYDNENPEDLLWKLVPIPSKRGEQERFMKFKSAKIYDEILGTHRKKTLSPSLVMGIANMTPDSFSDGSESYLNVEEKLKQIKEMVNNALQLHEQVIIDIGGCSTRPNSVQVSEDEELARVIPLIRSINEDKDLPLDKVIISVDTYRGKVAEEAIKAGADMINDISGGSFDKSLFEVISRYPSVPYVLSHIRGDISNMTKMTKYSEVEGDHFIHGRRNLSENTVLLRNVGKELSERYLIAIEKGIRRSQIIIDPGIGFAKNAKQNLKLIRQTALLKDYSYIESNAKVVNFRNLPILLGASRKKFIGTITQEENPENRDFTTGSLMSSCVGFGADILRVHNVRECSKSIKLANELYRNDSL